MQTAIKIEWWSHGIVIGRFTFSDASESAHFCFNLFLLRNLQNQTAATIKPIIPIAAVAVSGKLNIQGNSLRRILASELQTAAAIMAVITIPQFSNGATEFTFSLMLLNNSVLIGVMKSGRKWCQMDIFIHSHFNAISANGRTPLRSNIVQQSCFAE